MNTNSKRQEKIELVANNRREGIVVIEDVHDAHNAAAVMRSCDAFGWQKVWLIFNQEKEYDPKEIGKGSSSSANKWLDFRIFNSVKECFRELKKEDFEIWATVIGRGAVEIGGAEFNKSKTAIVLGNEHRGLSEEAIDSADKKLYIPMKGMVQSLNISVSAAIILYEIERQRQRKNGDFGLSREEKADLISRFRYNQTGRVRKKKSYTRE